MVREQRFDPRSLDLQAFAVATGTLDGAWPQAGFTRLADSLLVLPGDVLAPPVAWSAHGALRAASGPAAQVWLQLRASCRATLQCQRCLQPLEQPVSVDRWFRFVRDEEQAAQLDEECEDDVLVLSPRFDVHALLEDELILALPLVPRHAVCPEPLPLSSTPQPDAADDEAPHPFAALAAWRRPPTSD